MPVTCVPGGRRFRKALWSDTRGPLTLTWSLLQGALCHVMLWGLGSAAPPAGCGLLAEVPAGRRSGPVSVPSCSASQARGTFSPFTLTVTEVWSGPCRVVSFCNCRVERVGCVWSLSFGYCDLPRHVWEDPRALCRRPPHTRGPRSSVVPFALSFLSALESRLCYFLFCWDITRSVFSFPAFGPPLLPS